MNKADSGAVEERLARLERGVKRGKVATTAMMIVLVTLIAWSVAARTEKAQAAGSGELVARSLKIVDEKGHPCIVLTVDKEGSEVFLSDAKGHSRVVLAVTENGPTVMNLNDEKGRTLAALIVSKDGPGVILQDKKGNVRMGLEVTKDGPSLVLNEENKNARAVLGITSLETTDTGAKEVSAPSSLTLFDKEGKVIWRAP